MDYETWTTCEGVSVLHRYHGGCHEVLRDGKRIGSGRSRDEAMTAARCALGAGERRRAGGDEGAADEPSGAGVNAAPGSDEDWREALRVVREGGTNATLSGGVIDDERSVFPAVFQTHDGRGFGRRSGGGERHPTATAAARAYVTSRKVSP